jgi:hypothetical protein
LGVASEAGTQIFGFDVRAGYYSSGWIVYCAHHIGGRYLRVRRKPEEYHHHEDRKRIAPAEGQLSTSTDLNYRGNQQQDRGKQQEDRGNKCDLPVVKFVKFA